MYPYLPVGTSNPDSSYPLDTIILTETNIDEILIAICESHFKISLLRLFGIKVSDFYSSHNKLYFPNPSNYFDRHDTAEARSGRAYLTTFRDEKTGIRETHLVIAAVHRWLEDRSALFENKADKTSTFIRKPTSIQK
ncbi:hypothetical protein RF11_00243 [Thelohanellus kitauei]|uniref:Uncharacterized protein n=1 Tax=Thelohanellus kitauei TaxID=669202 RepID=A0A0C2JYU7_THEKT|nr:hypothetical protein RF11_00243 [Thelohanellus kitauei]